MAEKFDEIVYFAIALPQGILENGRNRVNW